MNVELGFGGPAVVDPLLQGRYRGTLELFDLAESIVRGNLRRENPAITPVEVERRLTAYILRRRDAPLDASGRLAHRFEAR